MAKGKKRVRRRVVFIPETLVLETIINTPLHPRTGVPITRKREVEERKKVHRGYHSLYLALLKDRRGNFYLREVLS